jgi:hypothetical protein
MWPVSGVACAEEDGYPYPCANQVSEHRLPNKKNHKKPYVRKKGVHTIKPLLCLRCPYAYPDETDGVRNAYDDLEPKYSCEDGYVRM